MRIREEYIVPALGAIILLSVFGFAAGGASPIYPCSWGCSDWRRLEPISCPPPSSVEIRIAIAALGLMILVIYFSSVSFWLALLAFGAIGASQIRHAAALSMPPRHTVAYVKTLLGRQGEAGTAGAESDGGDGSGETAPKAAAAGAALQGALGALQRVLRVNVGGVGPMALGALILISIFTMPWVSLHPPAGWGYEGALSITFQEASEEIYDELDDGVPGMLFTVLAIVAAVSMASVILPRWAVIVVGIGGVTVTLLSYIYIFLSFSEGGLFAIPQIGCFVAGGCFLAMSVLQLLPSFNKPRG